MPALLGAGVTNDGAHYVVTEWIEGRPLFDCLTFRAPLSPAAAEAFATAMEAWSCEAWAIAHASAEPRRVADGPEGLAALVRDCLAKSPEARPLDAGVLGAALESML